MVIRYLFLTALAAMVSSQSQTSTQAPTGSEVVYFIFPKNCFDNILNMNITFDCLARIVSNGLSLALVLFSLYYKVPQIMKILGEKSANSISPLSVLMEIMAALCGIAYYFYLDYDFMSYGEMVSGMVQSLIILLLCYVYKEMNGNTGIIYFGLIVSSITGIYLKVLPQEIANSFLMLSSVVYCFSRVMLVISVIRAKSSGSLSFITLFLSMAGILVRVLTTFVNLGDDRFLLLIVGINAFFSSMLFFVALMFKKPEKLKAN